MFREKFLKLFVKLKEEEELSDHYNVFVHLIKGDEEICDKLTE